MTELRCRMIADMRLRGLSPNTQRRYVDAIRELAKHYRHPPDQLSQEDIRDYFIYLQDERSLSSGHIRVTLYALKFLYKRTLDRHWPVFDLIRIKPGKKLPVVLSPEEARCLLRRVRRPGAKMSLTMMYTVACGSAKPCVFTAATLTAGGISSDRQQWLPARNNYLVPVEALLILFRGIFTDMVRRQLPHIRLPASLWHKNWVVYCKPVIQGPDKVLNYLARYVHRVAIPNSRIVSVEDGKVTFRYKPTKGSASKTMTLGAHEFLRRFLQHVLPKGVHKVRYYGLWSAVNRKDLYRVKSLLADDNQTDAPESQSQHSNMTDPHGTTAPQQKCPRCKTGTLVWLARIPRQERVPPS